MRTKDISEISIKHYVIIQQATDHIIIDKCNGCDLASDRFLRRSGCRIDVTHKIVTKLKIARHNFKICNNIDPSLNVVLTNNHNIMSGLATCYDLNKDVRLINPSPSLNPLDIFCNFPALSDLADATSLFADKAFLSFYTNGSLLSANTEHMTMGIGWIQSSTSSPNFEFKAKILDWPSSTRAETILILSAIIIYPVNCSIEIFTDSQCCIDTFKRVTSPIITSRRLEKVQNRSLWHVIRHFINLNSLHVSLKKVKRHSNDFFNNKADILAKQGCSSTSLLALNINHRFSPSPNIIAWSLKAID